MSNAYELLQERLAAVVEAERDAEHMAVKSMEARVSFERKRDEYAAEAEDLRKTLTILEAAYEQEIEMPP